MQATSAAYRGWLRPAESDLVLEKENAVRSRGPKFRKTCANDRQGRKH